MSYSIKSLKGDLFGGLTAGIVALPLALAFGVDAFSRIAELNPNFDPQAISALGAKAGLYGAMFLAFFAAIFGGTATQISGPTAPMTVVSKGIIFSAVSAALLTMTDPNDVDLETVMSAAIPFAIITFMLAGLLQVVFGVVRIGKLIEYIPHSVVSGFMSGIGVIIIISQIFPFFGLSNPGNSIKVVSSLGEIPSQINWYSVALASLTIAIVYILPRITKQVPSALVALILVTLVGIYVLPADAVSIIGEIPSEFPKPHIGGVMNFDWSQIWIILPAALTLAALGSIDSLLTSVVADNKTRTKHNSNRELIGQGLGNMVSGLFFGLPGAGATMRTVVNIDAGGKTKISGAISSLVILISIVAIGPMIGLIPKPVLSGILLTVGIGIIDYKGLKLLRKVPFGDALVLVIVLALTVFWDLIAAVGIGLLVSFIFFIQNMIKIASKGSKILSLKEMKEEHGWSDEHAIPAEYEDSILIKEVKGPLFFGFTSKFKEISSSISEVRYVIIKMNEVPYIDQTGVVALEDVVLDLETKGIEVSIVGLHEQPEAILRKIKVIPALVEEKDLHNTLNDSLAAISIELKKQNKDENSQDF